jgi:hypothetical protein
MTTPDEAMKSMDDMESRMPGNPYALIPGNKYRTDQATVQNQMALAFELHTANLIAYVDKIDDTSAAIPVVNEIRSRLGIPTAPKPDPPILYVNQQADRTWPEAPTLPAGSTTRVWWRDISGHYHTERPTS